MRSIYGTTKDELKEWLVFNGHKRGRADVIWQKLYGERAQGFASLNGLPEELIPDLEKDFDFSPLTVETIQKAADGTLKLLFRTGDGALLETVQMNHAFGKSVCVTTQIGCNMGCAFCASGLLPKQRDLTAGEIVSQIMHVQSYLDDNEPGARVSHIVVMGIGEPFDNYDNVMRFLKIVTDQKGLSIAPRRISVSTSGLAPMIRRFAKEEIPVKLAISLHAPNDPLRTSLMHVNHKYPIKELFGALDDYVRATHRRVNFEYIMIDGVNDQDGHALELAALLKPLGRYACVNLIPYNPVDENSFKRSRPEQTARFFDILMKEGIYCVTRKERGTEIEAACGQLRSRHLKQDLPLII